MFTGIIETTGIVKDLRISGTNRHFYIESEISGALRPDQSVAHDGVCLTVTECSEKGHWVTAVAETLEKTNLSQWQIGRAINLERALKMGERLDGHIVQGHVDSTAVCTDIKTISGSYIFRFRFPQSFAPLVIEKGSVCINGVSLTVFDAGLDSFAVTIIPYTFEHTTFCNLSLNNAVNIEFDILGKYFLRQKELNR